MDPPSKNIKCTGSKKMEEKNILKYNKRKDSPREFKRCACEINCREVSFVQYFAKQLLT